MPKTDTTCWCGACGKETAVNFKVCIAGAWPRCCDRPMILNRVKLPEPVQSEDGQGDQT